MSSFEVGNLISNTSTLVIFTLPFPPLSITTADPLIKSTFHGAGDVASSSLPNPATGCHEMIGCVCFRRGGAMRGHRYVVQQFRYGLQIVVLLISGSFLFRLSGTHDRSWRSPLIRGSV